MKKVLLFLLGILAYSCSDSENVPDNPTETDEIKITVSETTVTFSSAGGQKTVYIDSNTPWEAVAPVDDEWIKATQLSESELSISADENPGGRRNGKILIVTGISGNIIINVVQNEIETLKFCTDSLLSFSHEKQDTTLHIDTNIKFDYEILDNANEWMSISNPHVDNNGVIIGKSIIAGSLSPDNTSQLRLLIDENDADTIRSGSIRIFNEDLAIADTLWINQDPAEKVSVDYTDGSYRLVLDGQSGDATIVVMGDGFTDPFIKSGEYDRCVNSAIEHFFSIEPYTSYRDYFKVYTMVTCSEVEGVGNRGALGGLFKHNRFETAFGDGTEIVCNSDAIFECARSIPGLETKPITVIVVLNSKKYAGTTYMFSNGSSIALCPMSDRESPNDFEGLIHHEAGGHAFAFLADEYIYNESAIPDSEKENIRQWQSLGLQKNIDFTSDPHAIFWSRFIGEDGYDMVGAYPGGALYRYGVWRCEENSCMNNNVPYFNTQSRWLIVNRLMELSDKSLTFEDFVTRDRAMDLHPEAASQAIPSTTSRSSAQPLQPLAPPKLIMQ